MTQHKPAVHGLGSDRAQGAASWGARQIESREGESMPEHQPQVVADRVDTRDLAIRLISVFGMVGVALALLLAVSPT